MRIGSVLEIWTPEDKAFWEREGKAVAHLNLWISIPALLLSFAVWMVWSVVVVNLPNIGFTYTTNQLFWLAALPALCEALDHARVGVVRAMRARECGIDTDTRDRARLEGHAADRAAAGRIADDLRMHRAGPLGLRRGRRDGLGLERHAAFRAGAGPRLPDLRVHGAREDPGVRGQCPFLPVRGIHPCLRRLIPGAEAQRATLRG